MIERNLTHTNVLWGYLNILVALDVLKTFLKTHLGLRDNACLLVRTRCTDVGQLLCLRNVDNEVVVVNMLTNNLSAINFLTRINEELTTIL